MMRGRLGTVKDDYRRLWEAGTVSALPDIQLLERFAAQRDDVAFAALVARHGPLVWAVCRSVLRDSHDVEDAYQATFLILARKAHALWVGDSLCRWLYRVSYRVAQHARAQRDRRRSQEQAMVKRVAIEEQGKARRDELLQVLNHEINRLPEKYRLPIVLCRLDGLSRTQAADQLGWPPGTVATRLLRGQDLLRRRMKRRLGDDADSGLSAWLGGLVTGSVPAACQEATVRAAVTLNTRGWVTSGLVSSASRLAHGALRAMFWTSVRSFVLMGLSIAVVTWFTSGSLRYGTSPASAPTGRDRLTALPQNPLNDSQSQKPKPAVSDLGGDRLTYAGKVLSPDGKSFSGATIHFVLPYIKGDVFHRLQISGPDGRFRATVSRRQLTRAEREDPWTHAKVVATAPGYGPVWESTPMPAGPDSQRPEDLTLRLAPDDVPIEGRIVTAEGRPVSGAKIKAFTLTYSQDANGAHIPWDSKNAAKGGHHMLLGSLVDEATTDADGRFHMTGLGRDRLVSLLIKGSNVAQQEIQVQTRRVPTRQVEVPVDGRPVVQPMYGASFVHIAEPARSIQGIVRERGTGKPIAGALVSTLTTDAQGRFQFDNLPRQFKVRLDVDAPAGAPYFRRRLTVNSQGPGLSPVAVEIELSRGVLVRGRLTDKVSGKPVRGRVFYAPFKGNPNASEIQGYVENDGISDDAGRFALVGLPGRGVLIVTAGTGDELFYPRLRSASPEHRTQGLALPDDESLLDTIPRPVSLIGVNAYRVIDVPEAQDEFRVDLALGVKPGRTLVVRVVDPSGNSLDGVTAFGLREPTLSSRGIRGDGAFGARDLDAAWPRRVFFHQPERDLACFVDLTGNESGDVTARLSPCGSIPGRVVDGEGKPIAGAKFELVYDDTHGIPHVAFPTGSLMLTDDKMKREKRTNVYFEQQNPLNGEISGADGQFRIRDVVPGARFHLHVIIDQAGLRLGPMAPANRGEKLLLESRLSPGQALDLGVVRIRPEELRGDNARMTAPPPARQ
jgi:RNA polymerase sigma factor (sigma-70 family)